MSAADRRARFHELHAGDQLFVMPNPWDVGSARLLASCGFEALATTSAGLAWSLGKLDQAVSRDELVAHVAALADATPLPLNVDSERCYPDDPGGVAETVALLAGAGAAGCSIEDYDPAAGRVDDLEVAAERVAIAAQAAHDLPDPMVLTGRAENHIRGVDDLDDTIARLIAYRDAGADAVYAPGLRELDQIAAVVEAVGVPVNVLALRDGPTVAELASVGVRRVSTGGLLAGVAYGALLEGARELLAEGTSSYASRSITGEALRAAFEPRRDASTRRASCTRRVVRGLPGALDLRGRFSTSRRAFSARCYAFSSACSAASRRRCASRRRRSSARLSTFGAAGFAAVCFGRAGTRPGSSPNPEAVRSSCRIPRSSSGCSSGSIEVTRSVCSAFSSVGPLSLRRRRSRWTRSSAPRCSWMAAFRSAPFLPDTAASCAWRSRFPDWISARTSDGSSRTSSFSAAAATLGFGRPATDAASSGSSFFSSFARSLRAAVNLDSGSP